ncbi:hypothetical protein [Microbacterium sp.]|uniref:hypothetical protein n=1 Tax=Microbacterium sp. TaxID=51671 RepID=UPI003A9038D3
MALGIFRLVLPYLAILRWPLVWALAISIGSAIWTTSTARSRSSRTLGLLFFFTLGWWLRERDVVRVPAHRFPPLVAARARRRAQVWAFVCWRWLPTWDAVDLRYWFFYDDSYAGLAADQWWAGGIRLGLIALALLLSASFLVLMPRGRTAGRRSGSTMYVYLLHSFVLYPFRRSGVLRASTRRGSGCR